MIWVIAFIASCVFFYLCKKPLDQVTSTNAQTLGYGTASILSIWIATPTLWDAALSGYSSDSFFTLSMGGRTGVLIISLTLILLFFALVLRISEFFFKYFSAGIVRQLVGLSVSLLVSWVIFGLLFSLSPQVYYAFYQVIIPDLPTQFVVKSLFNISMLMNILMLPEDGSLSNHLSGMTLWATIPFCAYVFLRKK